MNFETLREQARIWWENQEAGSERELGYVVIFNGQIVGWKRELDNPQGWEPSCLAVAADGSVYEAVGGNDYDGAEAWLRLEMHDVPKILYMDNGSANTSATTSAILRAPSKTIGSDLLPN